MDSKAEDAPKFSTAIDKFILGFGNTLAWLNVLLIGVIILQVFLRYVLGSGRVVLEELQWHLYGVGIVVGLSYCLVKDSHIRLDLLHGNFSKRGKEKVEIFGILFLLMPLVIVLFLHSVDFFHESWKVNERSDAPIGLPWRWLIKSFLPISFALLFAAAVSRLVRAFHFLKNTKGS